MESTSGASAPGGCTRSLLGLKLATRPVLDAFWLQMVPPVPNQALGAVLAVVFAKFDKFEVVIGTAALAGPSGPIPHAYLA